MNIGETIRERVLAEARKELIALVPVCDNLWVLQEAINVLKPEKPKP